MPSFPLPPFAYVPGRTERHPEGFFDEIRQTAAALGDAGDLFQSEAWVTGLQFLDSGFFWEAHEVIEPVWLALDVGTPQRQLAQAVIQLANAELKRCMDRPNAVRRLCDQVSLLLTAIPEPVLDAAGLERKELEARIAALRAWSNLQSL
ncbi:MAG: DUF309 domain-containing protein [Rhodobacteraceae bacterium]|nr:DUF309 domain-containing protein [Paracoccaceae bacterium]